MGRQRELERQRHRDGSRLGIFEEKQVASLRRNVWEEKFEEESKGWLIYEFIGYGKGFGFNSKPLKGQIRSELHFKGITLAAVSRTDARKQRRKSRIL